MSYRVEPARSGRSKCKGKCKQSIEKGQLRLGSIGQFNGQETVYWRCLNCVTAKQLQNILHSCGNLVNVELFDELSEENKQTFLIAFQPAAGKTAKNSNSTKQVSKSVQKKKKRTKTKDRAKDKATKKKKKKKQEPPYTLKSLALEHKYNNVDAMLNERKTPEEFESLLKISSIRLEFAKRLELREMAEKYRYAASWQMSAGDPLSSENKKKKPPRRTSSRGRISTKTPPDVDSSSASSVHMTDSVVYGVLLFILLAYGIYFCTCTTCTCTHYLLYYLFIPAYIYTYMYTFKE